MKLAKKPMKQLSMQAHLARLAVPAPAHLEALAAQVSHCFTPVHVICESTQPAQQHASGLPAQ